MDCCLALHLVYQHRHRENGHRMIMRTVRMRLVVVDGAWYWEPKVKSRLINDGINDGMQKKHLYIC